MSGHHEPTPDAGDDHDHIMNDCISIDGFTPSLPTLINRPPGPDSDAQSVSDVESISNGETVDDDFDEITYSEIPALARRGELDECPEADMEKIMMSDRTIVPDMIQRMPQLSLHDNDDDNSTCPPEAGRAHMQGLFLAAEAFHPQKDPLRLAFVGHGQTSPITIALVVSKMVTAITGDALDKERMLDAATHTVPSSLDSLSLPVVITHVVGYDAERRRLLLNGGEERNVEASAFDFAVIYHKELAHIPHVHALATELACLKTPMLELSNKDGSGACVLESTLQDGHFVCMRLPSDHGSDDTSEPKDTPISLETFVYGLEDDTLSRHLAYISNHVKSYPDERPEHKPSLKATTSFSLLQHPWFSYSDLGVRYVRVIFSLISLSAFLVHYLNQGLWSGGDNRTTALQLALNNSGMANVNASDVLRYPATITVNGLPTTTTVAFPSFVHVQVLKSDQLLVSLPSSYKKKFHVDVFKNGKALDNVNATSLINGVCVLALPSVAAHGQVQVSVFLHDKPEVNETVKVDLGNRLLHRVTYETAAKGVQQEVSDAHSAAKLIQAKLTSDLHSIFNHSVYGIRHLGLGVVDGIRVSTDAVGTASNHTAQTIKYMGQLTYNTSSVAGFFLKSAVPQKRHFVRARTNALKIRTRLVGKSSVAKQNVPVKKPDTVSRALSGIRSQVDLVAEFLADSAPVRMVKKGSRKVSSAPVKSKTTVTSTTVVAKKSTKTMGLEGKKQCAAPGKHAPHSAKAVGRK